MLESADRKYLYVGQRKKKERQTRRILTKLLLSSREICLIAAFAATTQEYSLVTTKEDEKEYVERKGTVSIVDGLQGRNDTTTRRSSLGPEMRECTGKCACELPAAPGNRASLPLVDVATIQNYSYSVHWYVRYGYVHTYSPWTSQHSTLWITNG